MKRFFAVLFVFLLVATLYGCGRVENNAKKKSMGNMEENPFVICGSGIECRIVYHRDTKVMYAVSNMGYSRGMYTVLVNADGSPMIFGG